MPSLLHKRDANGFQGRQTRLELNNAEPMPFTIPTRPHRPFPSYDEIFGALEAEASRVDH